MPYYLVEYTLASGKLVKGVKEHPSEDVDLVFKELKHQAEMHLKMGGFHNFDCVKLSRWSYRFIRYLTKNGIPYNPLTMVPNEPGGPHRA